MDREFLLRYLELAQQLGAQMLDDLLEKRADLEDRL